MYSLAHDGLCTLEILGRILVQKFGTILHCLENFDVLGPKVLLIMTRNQISWVVPGNSNFAHYENFAHSMTFGDFVSECHCCFMILEATEV